MRKSIILFALLSVFLMMLLPTISATQQSTLKEIVSTRKATIFNKLQHGATTVYIDFINIYLLICNILVSVFMGKPSLNRMMFNILTIYIILYELKTGEEIPKCSNVYGAVLGMPFMILGAMIYGASNSQVVKIFALLITTWIYYACLAFAANAMT